MKNLHNVEKSAFNRGEYVGYSCGVWSIVRWNGGWKAYPRTDVDHGNCVRSIVGPTLEDISNQLANRVPNVTLPVPQAT